MGLSLSQEIQHAISVIYEDNRVISQADYNYEFTGGAHGNYITNILNIDKRTGAKIKLADVLNPEGIQMLPKILEAVLSMQYSLDKTKTPEQNGKFVKAISPSANFYVSNGNIGFIYFTCSVMAYLYGEPNLFIPASAIDKFIKPAFKKK